MLAEANLESPRTIRTRRQLQRTLRYVLVGALSVLSFAGDATKRVFHTAGRLHLAGHVFVFALISYLFVTTARTTRARLVWTTVMIVFGCAIELGQHFVFGQPVEFFDIASDSLGCLLGLLAWRIVGL
jgi:hypothetical protein